MIAKRTLLLLTALVNLGGTATADVKVVKDFRYPFLRTSIMNPQSIEDRCLVREYRVFHRLDADGRPYDVEVEPIGDAESELIPSVIEAFYLWRFEVPKKDDWRAEFLSTTHESTFWTAPHCDCDGSCDEIFIDEETRTLIDNFLEK